jgi:hypothetical protein
MSLVERIADVQQKYEMIERSTDFAAIARLLLAGRGEIEEARGIARQSRASARVKKIFQDRGSDDLFMWRAAQTPAAIVNTPALVEYKIAASGFAASLANVGVFDRLLGGGFRVLPTSLCSVGAINVGAVAAVVDEAAPKPVSSLSVTAAQVVVRKAAALLVLTSELARVLDPQVDNIIGAELRKACVKAVDGKFLAVAIASAAAANASGSNLPAFFGDLAFLLNAIGVDDSSRIYLIVTSSIAKQISLMLAQGSATSTAMSPSGGTIAGVEVLVSDALSAGQMVCCDANAFACAADLLVLSTLRHASVQFDSSPDSPATASTNFESLWATNKVGLLAERFFIAEKLRSNGAAVINGASYGSGFSP